VIFKRGTTWTKVSAARAFAAFIAFAAALSLPADEGFVT